MVLNFYLFLVLVFQTSRVPWNVWALSIHCKTTCFSSLFHFALFSPIQSQGKIFRARYSGEVRPCSEATTTLHCLQLNLHDAALSALDVAQSGLAESWETLRWETGSLLLESTSLDASTCLCITLHCGFHPTLAAAHRYVLVRPLWIPPCPAWLAPCSRTFSPEAGIWFRRQQWSSQWWAMWFSSSSPINICFWEIGTWLDTISQKSTSHRDKQNVGRSSLKHYTFKNHIECLGIPGFTQRLNWGCWNTLRSKTQGKLGFTVSCSLLKSL